MEEGGVVVSRGARSNCMLGGQTEWGSTQLVATVVREKSQQPTVHLAIIQACFTSSSRVLLVSNLRRSNWKCTVKRFFKSTVMIVLFVCGGEPDTHGKEPLFKIEPNHRCTSEWKPLFGWYSACGVGVPIRAMFVWRPVFASKICCKHKQYPYLDDALAPCVHECLIISLRLLALILCSNCSSVVNTALATIGGHLLTYFLSLGGPLELAQCPPHIVMAFHAPPWVHTPIT